MTRKSRGLIVLVFALFRRHSIGFFLNFIFKNSNDRVISRFRWLIPAEWQIS